MLTLNDGRSELWQWDTGRTLSVDADCSQVHFSNKVFGRSIDVDVVDGVAIIPDILLQTDNDLNVWAFVGTAENGYTKISKTFKVNRRNKPADYVFTPTEQTTLSKLVDRLDKIEESQSPEAIKNVVDDYLAQNPVEIPVQSVNGQTGAVELTAEDVGAISDETDPTVPEWAKQPTKPTYTAAEVGALPDTYTPPNQTAQQVGADPAGTAASAVSQHNTDAASHNDLRLALQELSDRINAALDSDDATLDQMSEVVAYIKSNKSMIDAITTSKVSVSDIVNNLTTDISNKPLSAAQGVALKELINALSNSMTAYRTAAAQDVIDSGKVDKVTGKGLSSNDYTDAAKAKVDALAPVATSGNYDDLTNKPTIPAPVTEQTVSGWGFTKNTGGSTDAVLYTPQTLTDAQKKQARENIDADVSSVPKPLTYDYMPEGYPSKSVGTVTLMEEQEVTFTNSDGIYQATAPVKIDVSEGQTYTVVWDGVEYSCVCHTMGPYEYIGNPKVFGSESTGEPFLYLDSDQPMWASYDTSTSHTIKITTIDTVYQTIDVNMLPKAGENYGVVKKDEIVTAYVFPTNFAPQAQMNKAVDDFAAGKAKITWGRDTVLYAERLSDTEVAICLSDEPVNIYKYTADEERHAYYKFIPSECVSSEIQVQRIYLKKYDDPLSSTLLGPITGVYNSYDDKYIEFETNGARIYKDGIAIKSSGSSKMFKITVDDSGTISATKVT